MTNQQFNTELLINIPLEKKALAKIILNIIFNDDSNIWDYFNGDQHLPQFKSELRDVVNEIVLVLMSKGVIEVNYEGNNSRMSLLKPLLVSYQTNLKDIVDNARSYFLSKYSGVSGKSGSNLDIEILINQWRIKYPNKDITLIPRACRLYVDSVEDKTYLMDMKNFILNEKGESKLAAYFDDLDSTTPKKNRLM